MPQISNPSQASLFRMANAYRKGKLDTKSMDKGLLDKIKQIANSKIKDKALDTTAKLKNDDLPAKVFVDKKGKVTKKKVTENIYIKSYKSFISEGFIDNLSIFFNKIEKTPENQLASKKTAIEDRLESIDKRIEELEDRIAKSRGGLDKWDLEDEVKELNQKRKELSTLLKKAEKEVGNKEALERRKAQIEKTIQNLEDKKRNLSGSAKWRLEDQIDDLKKQLKKLDETFINEWNTSAQTSTMNKKTNTYILNQVIRFIEDSNNGTNYKTVLNTVEISDDVFSGTITDILTTNGMCYQHKENLKDFQNYKSNPNIEFTYPYFEGRYYIPTNTFTSIYYYIKNELKLDYMKIDITNFLYNQNIEIEE